MLLHNAAYEWKIIFNLLPVHWACKSFLCSLKCDYVMVAQMVKLPLNHGPKKKKKNGCYKKNLYIYIIRWSP